MEGRIRIGIKTMPIHITATRTMFSFSWYKTIRLQLFEQLPVLTCEINPNRTVVLHFKISLRIDIHLVYFSNVRAFLALQLKLRWQMCMSEFFKWISRQEVNRIQIRILPLTMDQNPDPRHS
jgi:hypothetical protein